MLTTHQLYNRIKRAASAGLSATLALGVVLMVAPSVHAATLSPTPQITFTFDDGFASAYQLAAPALSKYGYSGTNYIISDCIGMTTVPNTCGAKENAPYMSAAQITDLHATYKWEIGSHTKTHPLLVSSDPDFQPTPLTPVQAEAELSQSQADILAKTGIKPMAFANPYGDYDPMGANIIAKVAKYYTSMRGFQDSGYNIFPYNDYLLLDQMVQLDNGTDADSQKLNITVEMAKTYIDTAVANNRWLILTFHDIVASGAGATGEYQYNVADLEAIAAYAQSKGMKGTNISDGLANNPSGGNLMSGYTFDAPVNTVTTPVSQAPATDTTAATTWTTDTPAGVSQDTTGKGNLSTGTNTASMVASGSTGALHLFSPLVAVENKAYAVKAFVNTQEFSLTSELAFYVDEYDATGAYLGNQYKRSLYHADNPEVINGAGNPLTRMYTFEYIPTSATVAKARLQVTAATGTGIKCYIDNIQWWAQDGSTTNGAATKAGDVNGDTVIDGLDLSVVLGNWHKVSPTNADGDLNADGAVDGLDLSVILSNWGK